MSLSVVDVYDSVGIRNLKSLEAEIVPQIQSERSRRL
jgi:hypothetical protein